MAQLPNKQFWVNYNARNYDSATHTIAKEQGQMFDQDLVLRAAAAAYTDTYVTIDTTNSRMLFNFQDTASNPFNRTAATASMTFIAKVASSNNVWFVSNRKDGTVGWMVKLGKPIYQMAYTDNYNEYSSSTTPTIFTWRCGNGTQQWIDHTNNVVGTPYTDTTWVGRQTTQFVVFGSGGGENWTGDFYWVYISPEVLTDAEIQAVIDYNENLTVFEPSEDTFAFGFSGGIETFTVTADNSWTCETPSNFTVSPLSGSSGETTVTITAPSRLSDVSDTVTFTDSEQNIFDITISQSAGTENPNLTMYRNGNAVKKMYHNGSLVYRKMSETPTLTVSTDSLNLPFEGGSDTVTITSSAEWTATTAAEWLTITVTSGGITVTATAASDNRTATITVMANNGFLTKSETISIVQKNVQRIDYVTTEYSEQTGTFIDTGIYPTTDTVFKVKYKPFDNIGGALVGYKFHMGFSNDTPTGSVDDNTDYRFFNAYGPSSIFFDFNSSRINSSSFATADADGYVTIECGNNYVTDINSSNTLTGTTQSSMATTGVPIYLNICSQAWVQSLEIWDNNVKVYDGYAANNGTDYGWYDSIGDTFTTQTYGGYAMTGPAI